MTVTVFTNLLKTIFKHVKKNIQTLVIKNQEDLRNAIIFKPMKQVEDRTPLTYSIAIS